MLTQKQKDLLIYIHSQMHGGSVAPSFEEMKDALGLHSKSGVHRLISGLVERGYLKRLPNRARALEVIKLPEGYKKPKSGASARDHSSIPLYGKIAAGTPIEAIRNETGQVDVPKGMLGAGNHYALTVDGDSMIDAGIHDGDTVIIRETETAQPGTIIVALVDGEEVTLKTLGTKNGKLQLIPANPAHKTREFTPDRVRIQGKLVGMYRTYH